MSTGFIGRIVDLGTSFVPVAGIAAGTYRVPMQRSDSAVGAGEYAVATGYKQIRYYNDTTLPDTVKSLMTMVKAFPETHNGFLMSPTTAYLPPTEAQIEIGWKFGPYHYMLVMKDEDFSHIQLEISHGNDTRR